MGSSKGTTVGLSRVGVGWNRVEKDEDERTGAESWGWFAPMWPVRNREIKRKSHGRSRG